MSAVKQAVSPQPVIPQIPQGPTDQEILAQELFPNIMGQQRTNRDAQKQRMLRRQRFMSNSNQPAGVAPTDWNAFMQQMSQGLLGLQAQQQDNRSAYERRAFDDYGG